VALVHLTVTAWFAEVVETLVGAVTLLVVVSAMDGVPSANTHKARMEMAKSRNKARKRSSNSIFVSHKT
jgi:hypothetical protein